MPSHAAMPGVGRRVNSMDPDQDQPIAVSSQGFQDSAAARGVADGGQQQHQQHQHQHQHHQPSAAADDGGRDLVWDHPPAASKHQQHQHQHQRTLSPMHVSHDARALDGANAQVNI